MAEEPLVVETGVHAPDACVIWLHGLGADGHDFEPIVPELRLDPGFNIRFVFPHAPMMPVTINQGFVMRAWYDIRSADIDAEPDEKGIRASSALLCDLIDGEIAAGIAPEKIVLAGFSQGGAIVLQAGLRYEKQLAGIMALSTYLPLADCLGNEKSEANGNTPIFLAHGSADPVVPVDLAYLSQKVLEREGYSVEWHEYQGMAHGVSEQEIFHLGEWLEKVLM
ncbi:MAG: carboxylesterase [Gammaproteobacteria bacterium]|nr:carboxylesterase [Gammaproteobacteria bacterium]MCP4980678.1 carboxylesterase [Gammaproteobacteria bacterium]